MTQCMRCGGVGHFARECSQPITCNNCGARGHISRTCPMIRCDRCGRAGHFARDCPKATAGLKCYDCQQTGHLAKDCPNVKKKVDREDPSSVRKSKELAQFHQERARLLADANSRLSAKLGLMGAWGSGDPDSSANANLGVKRQRVGDCRPAVSLLLRRKGDEDDFGDEAIIKPISAITEVDELKKQGFGSNEEKVAVMGGNGTDTVSETNAAGLSMLAGYGSEPEGES